MKCATVLLVLAIAVGCGSSRTSASAPGPSQAVSPAFRAGRPVVGTDYRLSGPYVHGNLAVYLIHADRRDEREFITLDEGLKAGSVRVREQDNERVQALQLENRSAKPLFVQDGDRVIGGKQDRIIGSSFVVPSGDEPVPVPSFCVESGRWNHQSLPPDPVSGLELSRGSFYSGANIAPAPKSVRLAAKYGKDQQGVWRAVERTKASSLGHLGTANSNSSLNETMEDAKVKKLCDDYAAALGDAAAKYADALGVAFAIDGVVEEIDIYPGHALLVKLYPRLVQSFALVAAFVKQSKPVPSSDDVAKLLLADGSSPRRERINEANELSIIDSPDVVRFVTHYEGRVVHAQWLKKEEEEK